MEAVDHARCGVAEQRGDAPVAVVVARRRVVQDASCDDLPAVAPGRATLLDRAKAAIAALEAAAARVLA